MKNLKIGVLVFGALGLAMLLTSNFGQFLKYDKVNAILMLAAFGLPTAMGAMGLAKPPFLQWQAGVAAAGFGLAAVKTRIWSTLPHIMDASTQGKIAMVAIVGGVVVSVLALAKPEETA